MRRTLSVVAMTAALLVPTTVALATSGSNASCNNGKGGNGADWNGKGNGDTALCEPKPPAGSTDDGGALGPGMGT